MILSTVAFLVVFAAIFILFSEELRLSLKKLYSSSKIMLVVYLFVASMLFLIFEDRIDILLAELRIYLYSILYLLGMSPTHLWHLVVGKILILSLIAFILIVAGKLLAKISIIKKLSKNIYNVFLVSAAYLWLLFCIVLVVNI